MGMAHAPNRRSYLWMGTLGPLLALTALWAGPEIPHNNSWVGPFVQNRYSAIIMSFIICQ